MGLNLIKGILDVRANLNAKWQVSQPKPKGRTPFFLGGDDDDDDDTLCTFWSEDTFFLCVYN